MPGPTFLIDRGETARITLRNRLPEETIAPHLDRGLVDEDVRHHRVADSHSWGRDPGTKRLAPRTRRPTAGIRFPEAGPVWLKGFGESVTLSCGPTHGLART